MSNTSHNAFKTTFFFHDEKKIHEKKTTQTNKNHKTG